MRPSAPLIEMPPRQENCQPADHMNGRFWREAVIREIPTFLKCPKADIAGRASVTAADVSLNYQPGADAP
jgi:hypothetical protein